MAELSELESKFLKADALAQAGDQQAKADASLFAAEIKRMRTPAAPKIEPKPEGPSSLYKVVRGMIDGGPVGGIVAGAGIAMDKANSVIHDVAHSVGGGATDLAMKAGASPEVAAGIGTAANISVQTVPAVLGGKVASTIASPAMQAGARSMMQMALKPILSQLKQGKAGPAIETMLDEGISLTPGGISKLRVKIADLNREIAEKIRDSTATIDKQEVWGSVKQALDKFTKQANPNSDIATIRKAWSEFLEHPLFAGLGAKESELAATVAQKEAAKVSALRDAGRFKTMEQQQANLARGGEVRLAPEQTANTPYINVGSTGGRATSPSAYPPAPGEVRFPARYTDNAQRVPEAKGAHEEAMRLVEQRRAELQQATEELAAHRAAGGSNVPVQTAQEIKQGTYRVLGEKSYGELKGAEVEAQKGIARGLKEAVAKAVPEVAPLNAKESELLNAVSVAERRVLMQANNNPMGLSLLAKNPAAWAAFMADRSGPFKSMIARIMNASHERIPQALGSTGVALGEGLHRN